MKRQNNARQKDEKPKCATQNDEKRAHGLFSLFRLFAWRNFVFSLFRVAFFRLFAWRFFVFSPHQNAKRKDEKMKKRHAKIRNKEKTPREKTK